MEFWKRLARLSPDELDIIREVASIGSGHSATALSDMLGKTIQIKIPSVRIVPMESVAYTLLNETTLQETVAGIFMETTKEAYFETIVFLNQQSIGKLLQSFFSSDVDLYNLSEEEESAIGEIANILHLHFVSALGSFLDGTITPSNSPLLVIDLAEAIINAVLMRSGDDIPSFLVIENLLFADREECSVHSLVLFSESLLQQLLDSISS